MMKLTSEFNDMTRSTKSITAKEIAEEGKKEHDEVTPANLVAPSGLSELSKQLRLLHQTNHSQAAEIDKLKRKLNVLSDLKGVDVKDLKSALKTACDGEAHNELRMEVETLKAQLDLARSNTNRFTPESDAMANLELRVGELEEVEESLRAKVSSLYDSLREQTARATEFESLSTTREHQIQQYKLKYEALQNDLKREHDAVIKFCHDDFESKELFKAQEEEKVTDLSNCVFVLKTENEAAKASIDHLENQLSEKETQLKVNAGEQQSLKAQLKSTEEEAMLRKKQFECRVAIQDERIDDLEQQLSSLVVAFNLERDERTVERKVLAELTQRLVVADTEVAHFHHHVVMKRNKCTTRRSSHGCKPALSRLQNSRRLGK